MEGYECVSAASFAGMDRYEEACRALASPPHRWGEWVAVFHPKFDGQIVGYRRLRRKDWFLLPEGGRVDEVVGPYATKGAILRMLGFKTSKQVQSGVYTVEGWILFTRDRAEKLNLQEPLP
jgi:hypothetical protein